MMKFVPNCSNSCSHVKLPIDLAMHAIPKEKDMLHTMLRPPEVQGVGDECFDHAPDPDRIVCMLCTYTLLGC